MSRFREELLKSTYDAHQATISHSRRAGRAFTDSPEAHRFCFFAHADDSGRPNQITALLNGPYSDELARQYEELSSDARSDVLGWETVVLHELTHSVDFLATPAGATFHTYLAEEYVALNTVLRFVYDTPAIDISAPLPEWLPQVAEQSSAEPLRQAVETAYRADLFFRSMRQGNRRTARRGWEFDDRCYWYWPIMGRELELVTVLGDTKGVAVPDTSGELLRLSTILEGRALAHCLRHILHRFENRAGLAAGEMQRYLQIYYPKDGTRSDYWFLLDLCAGAFGVSDMTAYLSHDRSSMQDKEVILALDQVPILISVLTWYALNGPDPVDRFLNGLGAFWELRLRDVRASDPGQLIRQIDEELRFMVRQIDGELFRESVIDINTRLWIIASDLERIVKRLRTSTGEDVQQHFVRILTVIGRQLRDRIGSGYITPWGIPFNGNPIWHFSAQDEDDFGGKYEPPPRLSEWVQLREQICYRRHGSDSVKREAIGIWLGIN